MEKRAIIILNIENRNYTTDLDIPLDITANEFVKALNSMYGLSMDTSDAKRCYLKSENPIALLKGNKLLSQFGIHNGTIVKTNGEG